MRMRVLSPASKRDLWTRHSLDGIAVERVSANTAKVWVRSRDGTVIAHPVLIDEHTAEWLHPPDATTVVGRHPSPRTFARACVSERVCEEMRADRAHRQKCVGGRYVPSPDLSCGRGGRNQGGESEEELF